jgi:diguanylate cyclase (GGDEF)-like protein
MRRATALWAYVAALTALGGAAWLALAHARAPLMGPVLPWWAVAAGFAVGEICVVHVEFRRSAHSFSLSDVAFVFGLVFASGDAFVLGAMVGTGLVLAFHRRLELVKVAFNVVQLALAASVALAAVRLVAAPAAAMGPRLWGGLYLATLVGGGVTMVCIAGAVGITEGGLRLANLTQMFGMDGVVTVTNASIAIAAALVVATDARAVPVLIVPALTVFAAYRAYLSERQRHEKLEFLYEANRTLSRSPEVAEALEGLLARSLEAFRSEIAEVLLFSADGTALRTAHGPGSERVSLQPADRAVADELAALVDHDRPVVALDPRRVSTRLRAHLSARGIRHAMVAMLPGEERITGTLMLANRFGLERSYTADEMRLLEALANNATVALQYDRLEQAVTKLENLQEQLHHQAYHDPLTDLPNRTLFMERVRGHLAAGAEADVLFVDLDDFKTVNDSLGHAVGDALLVSVAERLRGCVRPQDTVARLGGDEFAVMLPGADGHGVAARVLRAFEAPVTAGAELLSVHLSIGVAGSDQAGGDADALIRNADVATYQARSRGKARYELFEPAMADAILRRHGLKEELAKAIEREQIVVQYQPIVLEITETQLLGDAEGSARRFAELRALGARIALDDFGTGYSSLSYLHSLDTLKIAKPFVDGLAAGGREAGFVPMIVEGVETPDRLAALRAAGAALGQGFLLGRPSAAVTGRAPAVSTG